MRTYYQALSDANVCCKQIKEAKTVEEAAKLVLEVMALCAYARTSKEIDSYHNR